MQLTKFAILVDPGFVKDYDFFVFQPDMAGARVLAIREPEAFSGLYCGRCGAEDIGCRCDEGVLRKAGRQP